MPYILYKTNGDTLTTIDDASIDNVTSLTLVGKNYAGYGQIINENFVKVLENFSNSTPPVRPLTGQIWFNSDSKTLNYSHNGSGFKGLANIFVQKSAPAFSDLAEGDLWWDKTTLQLKVFDGSTYSVIGPLSGSSAKAYWNSTVVETNLYTETPLLTANLDSNIVSVVSYREFTPSDPSELYSSNIFSVKPGITLPGTNSNGSSEAAGFYFWGSAGHSLYSNTSTYSIQAGTSTYAATAMTSKVQNRDAADATYYVSFVSTTTGTVSLLSSSKISYNPHTEVLDVTATSAFYADLAEKYEADNVYDEGTVLVIGGKKEVTISNIQGDTRVIGIVSKNPAYRMNSDAGPDSTHPYIALKGRVPCKVSGVIRKGDLLVNSMYAGYACAKLSVDSCNAVIGKALEDFSGGLGMIEVLVV